MSYSEFDKKPIEVVTPLIDQDNEPRSAPRNFMSRKAKILILASVLTALVVAHTYLGFGLINCLQSMPYRKQRINTGSQALSGDYNLYDLLSIKSTAGSINIAVHPQAVDEDHPAPADLTISSNAGQVNIDVSAYDAPKRDYRTSIRTSAGSVGGRFIHGRTTHISTKSASVSVDLTPYGADDYKSSLEISSGPGSQTIAVLSPAGEFKSAQINQMSSRHSSSAGSLDLQYPREWTGIIEGHSGSGSINLHGDGIEIIRQELTTTVGHYVLARKGNGSSTLNFQSSSGSVDIYIG